MAHKKHPSRRTRTSTHSDDLPAQLVSVSVGGHATLTGPREYLDHASTCLVALCAALLAAPSASESKIESVLRAQAMREGLGIDDVEHLLMALSLDTDDSDDRAA